MAGHNKWSKVKHKKAVEDSKKSREFSKFARLITAEVRKAGGDAENPAVKAAVARAKSANMPVSNIERAIERGKGKDAEVLEDVVYEAYGPAGVALIITGLTDNRNRTAAEVKHILTTAGATLAEPGAASWAFKKEDGEWVAETTLPISEDDAERLAKLTEALEENDDVQGVYTNAGAS